MRQSKYSLCHRLLLLIGLALLSEPLAVAQGHDEVRLNADKTLASVGTITVQAESRRAAAERAMQEGLQLYKQGTAESLKAAIQKFEEARKLYQEMRDRSSEATTLNNIGSVYTSLGEKQKALDYYNLARPLYRAVGDKSGEGYTLNNIARVYNDLGEKQKALDYYNQTLSLFQAVGDKSGEATTLNNIGLVYNDLEEKQKALDYYNQALPLHKIVGNKSGEASTLTNIGTVYNDLGEKQKALDYYNQALLLHRAGGDKRGEGYTLTHIGAVYNDLGEKQKALDYYNQALPLYKIVGDKRGEGYTLNNIGAVYTSLGEKQKALDYYNQALPLRRAVGDKRGQASTLTNIGAVYNDLGEKQKALDYYNQALPLRWAVGDKSGEASTLANIGTVYNDLGEKQKALDYYNQTLPLFQAVGDKSGEATTLNNIGLVYNDLGEKQKALDYYNQALPLHKIVGNKSGEGTTLNNIGLVYNDLGEKQKALDYYNQALPLHKIVGDKSGEASTLTNIGAVYSNLGEKQKALDYYNQALPLFRIVGNKSGEAAIFANFASLKRSQGNLKEALTDIEAAIKIIEDLRVKVASPELRASFFASKQDYYEFYIDLLMQLHKQRPSEGFDAKALHASERSKARSLLEILTEARADIRQGVEPKLLERERSLQQQLQALEENRLKQSSRETSKTESDKLNKRQEDLLNEYREVQAQIRATSPRYAALTQPQPLTLSEIQQQVLDDNTLLLSYSLGQERSYLWAVTKTSISSYELPKREEIEKAVNQFTNLLKDPNTLGEIKPEFTLQAKQLTEILLTPVANLLPNKRLLIVSDGALQYMPFAALTVPATATGGKDYQPLVVEHEIVNLPSASTIAVLRRDLQGRAPASKSIAVLADPVFGADDERVTGPRANIPLPPELARSVRAMNGPLYRLPFSRQEAAKIRAMVPEFESIQVLDFDASYEMATSPQLSQYRMVHFATHGLLNSANPALSGLVLSLVDKQGNPKNGFLRLHEIYNLTLPAELVMLSACQTGLGQQIRGEGLITLTRGFMYAGARRVGVSLWNVNDEATAQLMANFYEGMLKKGLQPVAALRAAQIQMWQQKKEWKHPRYWAAFTIQGEWR